MISKIAQTTGALMMISSVNGYDYNMNQIDGYTLSHEPETVGCAMCIKNNKIYHYSTEAGEDNSSEYADAGDAYLSDITISSSSVDVNFCAEQVDDVRLLTSNDFSSYFGALSSCPIKEDVCGTNTDSLSAVGDSTTFSVTDMTGKDMCAFHVDVACGVPKITLETVEGAFLDPK